MRKLIPITIAAALAACGGNESANNSAVGTEATAADIGPVNDATAIDAATGEAANMAAAVNFTLNEAEFNELAAGASDSAGEGAGANATNSSDD